ncbi:MAG: hypothetical protein ACRDNZ_12290, partial [Streptosporangiaceae bacterium]
MPKTEPVNLRTAELSLHERSRTAFAAATAAGLPGQFRAFERGGLLALLTTAPGLSFLNSVTGLTQESLEVLPEVMAVFAAARVSSVSLAAGEPTPALVAGLHRLGFVSARPRPAGIIDLRTGHAAAGADGLRLTEARTPE